MRRAHWISAAALGIVLAGATAAQAQAVTERPNGTVSVHARGIPLSAVLDAFEQVAPFEKRTVTPELASTIVTLDIEDVTIRSALIALLDAAGGDYALSAASDGGHIRLVAKAAGGGVTRPGNVTPRAAAEDSTKAGKPARTDAEAYSEPAAEQPVEKHESSYQAAVAAMTVLLTTQPTARVAGAVVDLPFPGPDGAPLGAAVGSRPASQPTQSEPKPFVPAHDMEPGRADLFEALLTGRKPGG